MKKAIIFSLLCASVLQSCATMNLAGSSSTSVNDINSAIRILQAAQATATAFTLTDSQVAALSKESIDQMDKTNKIADLNSKYTKRLNTIVKGLDNVNGTKLNFKVYITSEINAFACADGSIRVYSSLMDVMNDDELTAIIGHEIGHVAGKDTKDALKHAYLAYAALQAAGSAGGIIGDLTSSQLGDIAQSFISARYSQKQEYAADEYGFKICIQQGRSPYGMSDSLNKLVKLSNGAKASALQQMFSSHPDSEKRAAKMKTKADQYVANKSVTK